jgi:hypothetical protein
MVLKYVGHILSQLNNRDSNENMANVTEVTLDKQCAVKKNISKKKK